VAATLAYGKFRLTESHPSQETSPVKLALVKANVPSAQRWQRVRYASTLLAYAELSRQNVGQTQPDLVVWPEFALGFYLDKEPPLRVLLNQLTRQLNAPLLLGAPRAESAKDSRLFYNSAYLLTPGGAILDVYDKIRLLPFAESWPSFFPTLLEHRPEAPTDFTAGNRATIFALPQGRFGVLICYEATYPSLARRLVHDGAHFLVNISNDSWLAGEAASAQHFSMAVFRAVENRRAVARVATAGVSGFIDRSGRPTQQSAAQEESMLGEVMPQRYFSVYTRYGDWFVGVCLGIALWAILLARVQSTALRHESGKGATLPDAFALE
jgi:apolipoprotein N-acyltransferase